jgi:hypothetical protein
MCDCNAAKKPTLVSSLERCFSSRGLYDREQTLAAYRGYLQGLIIAIIQNA